MSSDFWYVDSDFESKKAEDVLRGILEDDSKNYEKAQSELKSLVDVLDSGLCLYIELLQSAFRGVDEWENNGSARSSLAMAQSALNYFLLARHGMLLGYHQEVRSLLRDIHERVTRSMLFRLDPAYADRFLRNEPIYQREVDARLAKLVGEEGQEREEALRMLRERYTYMSERVHPNLESLRVRTGSPANSNTELSTRVGKGYVFGGLMGDRIAAVVLLDVTMNLDITLHATRQLFRETSGAWAGDFSRFQSAVETLSHEYLYPDSTS